jgi:hypothetical protein
MRPANAEVGTAGETKNGGGAAPNAPAAGPTTRLTHRPLPPPRKIPQAQATTTKLNPVPDPKAGPKGTQKIQ